MSSVTATDAHGLAPADPGSGDESSDPQEQEMTHAHAFYVFRACAGSDPELRRYLTEYFEELEFEGGSDEVVLGMYESPLPNSAAARRVRELLLRALTRALFYASALVDSEGPGTEGHTLTLRVAGALESATARLYQPPASELDRYLHP